MSVTARTYASPSLLSPGDAVRAACGDGDGLTLGVQSTHRRRRVAAPALLDHRAASNPPCVSTANGRANMRNGRRTAGRGLAILVWMGGWAGTSAAAEPKVGHAPRAAATRSSSAASSSTPTAPVVLWTDPGGYDAYRVERRSSRSTRRRWAATQKPRRIRVARTATGSARRPDRPSRSSRSAAAAGTSPRSRSVVDQFVIHYDVARHQPALLPGPPRRAAA